MRRFTDTQISVHTAIMFVSLSIFGYSLFANDLRYAIIANAIGTINVIVMLKRIWN